MIAEGNVTEEDNCMISHVVSVLGKSYDSRGKIDCRGYIV